MMKNINFENYTYTPGGLYLPDKKIIIGEILLCGSDAEEIKKPKYRNVCLG